MATADSTFVTAEQVRSRYHISPATLWRWEHDNNSGFPVPLKVAAKKLYRLTDLEAWEALRMRVLANG